MKEKKESKIKKNGVVYTPSEMATFLAKQMILFSKLDLKKTKSIEILDPATGEGELLISLVKEVFAINPNISISITGFEIDPKAADKATRNLYSNFSGVKINIRHQDFLLEHLNIKQKFDFIIANPPYVRTQILGATKSQKIAQDLNLSGRIDIYYAFLLCIKKLLKQQGTSGYITSNKFFTIKSGISVRDFMLENYQMHALIDFGDTKLFTASVLPCIIIFSTGKTCSEKQVSFTSIYESKNTPANTVKTDSIFKSITQTGYFTLDDGRTFKICQGHLQSIQKGALWTISTNQRKNWLDEVQRNTWLQIADIGKVRVGIKTTADNVFIGNHWLGKNSKLELLKPLITHRDAGQIIASQNAGWKVLYTHTTEKSKKKPIDINKYPKSKAYLESHYEQLSARTYIQKAHRNWYEIWVPQNPDSWAKRKIVFRDISEKPEFWLDTSGSIVNGDCYWIEINDSVMDDIVYLALAVANSHFIEEYYDAKFNTKLYSGKRRYMSQYVEQFPIPSPTSPQAQKIIQITKKILNNETDFSHHCEEINKLINRMFGV